MARLVLNGGSSSWKCGLYDVPAEARAIDAAPPLGEAALSEYHGSATDAVKRLLDDLRAHGADLNGVESVGHRIVHGATRFTETTWLDEAALAELKALEPFAPSHNPIELEAVRAAATALPHARPYGVFDTQFHRTLTPEAFTYPGPADWPRQGIRRYGFHGTSVAYATERVAALLDGGAAPDLLVAHLGGGCSVTAVAGGRSAATSMGMTPLDGTMMGTRSGSIDPAIATFLMRRAAAGTSLGAFADDLDATLEHRSGLFGISGRSGDLRELREAEAAGDDRAGFALRLFVRRLAETIAAARTALGGLDALVFTGGIGEHGADVRARTVARLGFLGLDLDAGANGAAGGDAEITGASSSARVFVVEAREEWYIAREGARLAAR